MHVNFGIDVINQIKIENPHLWDEGMKAEAAQMILEGTELEIMYARDTMPRGVLGMNAAMMEEYLKFIANRRLTQIGLEEEFKGVGNPSSKSQALYESTCAQCHGELGQGVWTVNAPALTGLEDWYLASQIKNFRDGIRGRHADDLYGLQMGLVANTMTDDQAIEDMVAYISTLENPQQPVTLAQQN